MRTIIYFYFFLSILELLGFHYLLIVLWFSTLFICQLDEEKNEKKFYFVKFFANQKIFIYVPPPLFGGQMLKNRISISYSVHFSTDKFIYFYLNYYAYF